MLGHLAYLAVMTAIAASVPASALGELGRLALVIGAIGVWRYSWAAVNFSRALAYVTWVYPRRRRRAEKAYAERRLPAHAYFLVTTYKIEPGVTSEVYRALLRAAARSEGGATVVASIVDSADARVINRVMASMPEDMSGVKLIVDQIPGTGKRDALARSLRLIAREAPSARDVLVFVDGDSCVPEDIVSRAAPFFTDPRVGALTTDEEARIPDHALFRAWFDLRFNQRQMMMSSMALGGRVLTLTGRMSVFRADLATDPGFIGQVQHDHIDHWRLGRVNFLTGDDKSTWFNLLSRGYRMTYLPDLRSVSMETQPLPGFVESATTLMIRWFGNMMRTNGRALALGPRRIGLFTWWSILDQRVSVWTTLSGPVAITMIALFSTPAIVLGYISWVMFTRYLYCAALSVFRGGGFPIVYAPLLYFGQIVGASVKSYVMFRLDRQRWTRQSATAASGRSAAARLRDWSSAYMQTLAFGWLALGVLLMTGLL